MVPCGSHAQAPRHDSTFSVVPTSCDPKEFARMQAQLQDWAGLQRYRSDDTALVAQSTSTKSRVVFYGDSITDAWGRLPDTGKFFLEKDHINRGISGQTTAQMLVRFQQDVVNLHPAVVLILAGTNDVAGNTGPSTPEMIEDNYTSMVKIANESGIKVILASITPAYQYKWRPSVKPVEEIRQLNAWIRQYCGTGACTYLDYYSSMVDANGAMQADLTKDGVHPNAKGYGVMAPLADKAIAVALRR
jgi:lysophospholipase L1-like esterase